MISLIGHLEDMAPLCTVAISLQHGGERLPLKRTRPLRLLFSRISAQLTSCSRDTRQGHCQICRNALNRRRADSSTPPLGAGDMAPAQDDDTEYTTRMTSDARSGLNATPTEDGHQNNDIISSLPMAHQLHPHIEIGLCIRPAIGMQHFRAARGFRQLTSSFH